MRGHEMHSDFVRLLFRGRRRALLVLVVVVVVVVEVVGSSRRRGGGVSSGGGGVGNGGSSSRRRCSSGSRVAVVVVVSVVVETSISMAMIRVLREGAAATCTKNQTIPTAKHMSNFEFETTSSMTTEAQ